MLNKNMKVSRIESCIHVRKCSNNMTCSGSLVSEEGDQNYWPKVNSGSGREYSSLSDRTWTFLHDLQKSKAVVTPDRRVQSSISSRARQIKDHEADPFLSIDLLSDTVSISGSSKRDQTEASLTRASQLALSASSHRHVSAMAVRRRADEMTNGYCSDSRCVNRSATFISQDRLPAPSNMRVKIPFKHTVNNKQVTKMSLPSPGQLMRERTALAVDIVNKILDEQKSAQVVYIRGRLLKARLKNLEPVNITGPSIHQCRGIIAGARSYSACSSGIYQRMKSTLSESHTLKDVTENSRDPTSVNESIHRTSEATSPDPAGCFVSGYSDNDNDEL